MEDDLTWLARNVTDSHMCDWYIKVADGYSSMTGGTPTGMSGTWCSREQIIQRRAELQNKPSWDDAPEWANWLGQTSRGAWEWFQGVQAPDDRDDGCWSYKQLGESSGKYGEVFGDWRDTLERRPRDLSEPAVTARLTEATENVLAAVPALMGEKFSIDRNDWYERGELPPVGIECEVLWSDREWHKTKIIAHLYIDKFNMCPVFTTGWDDTNFVECMPHYQSFRPLRTERDNAVEDMKRHCPHHGSWDTVGRVYAEALYDAGYRKQG